MIEFDLTDAPVEFYLNADPDDFSENLRLLEDEEFRLLEDGSFRLLE